MEHIEHNKRLNFRDDPITGFVYELGVSAQDNRKLGQSQYNNNGLTQIVRYFYAKEKENEDTRSDNAQLTIDYIAGIGIFVISIAFVFQFMFSLFIPFQSNSEETTLSADRASTVLVERLFNADKLGSLNVIDQGELYDFINTKLNYSNETAYVNTLNEIGLFSKEMSFNLNLSVADLDGNLMNQSGPLPSTNKDIAQTKRIILIVNSSTGYNKTAIISVKVW